MSEEAAQVAYQRVERLIENLLETLKKNDLPEQDLLEKIKNPDIQYAIAIAQRQYARNGETSSMDLLTKLLSERFASDENSLKKVVINEAIEVMSKITLDQINNLTLLFLVKSCKVDNVRLLFDLIYEMYEKFGSYTDKESEFYEHLQYAGLLTNDITTLNHQSLGYLMSHQYPEDLDNNIAKAEYTAIDKKVRGMFDQGKAEFVFNSWNNSKIQDYSLTSVRKVIAISNFNNVFNAKLSINIWIKD